MARVIVEGEEIWGEEGVSWQVGVCGVMERV
jgi:hypothetical protein